MGLIYANIKLSNPKRPRLKPVWVTAMVDTGSVNLCIPKHVAVQLQLDEIETREVKLADDKPVVIPYVGPVQIAFENRSCFTGALVLGESVLMGVIPMEDMDLVISPTQEAVTVNPANPNIPCTIVK